MGKQAKKQKDKQSNQHKAEEAGGLEAKKPCNMPTPEKIRENRAKINEGADIAADTMMTDVMEAKEDDVVQTLESLFLLPDATDKHFWDTEIEGESKLWKVWKSKEK